MLMFYLFFVQKIKKYQDVSQVSFQNWRID